MPDRLHARPWLTRVGEALLARFITADSHLIMRRPLQSPPARLLIVKVHGLGDAVLVRCMAEHLRRHQPSIRIGVMTGVATREVMTMNADFYLHEYVQNELNVWSAFQTLSQIRARAYDAVLNFEQASLAGTGFLRATGIPNRVGFLSSLDSAKGAFLTHGLTFEAGDSMWQSFGRLLRLIDPHLPSDLSPIPLPLGKAAIQYGGSWLDENINDRNTRRVALHLGCGNGQSFKRWPVASFAVFAAELSKKGRAPAIILTGQPNERGLLAEFQSLYNGPTVDATTLGSITKTASVLSQMDLLVSNDTGVMHLGAAVGTPTIGLFGATPPNQWAPFGPRASYVYKTRLACSPCIDSYLNKVPARCENPRYRQCMNDISAEEVLAAARKVVRGNWLD